jgi:hypothetical protein
VDEWNFPAGQKRRQFLRTFQSLAIATIALIFSEHGFGQTRTVGKVMQPILLSVEVWREIRAKQGSNPHEIPIQVQLTIDRGRAIDARVFKSSGFPGADAEIKRWLSDRSTFKSDFSGTYVLGLVIDPRDPPRVRMSRGA